MSHLNFTGWNELSQTPILRPGLDGDTVLHFTDLRGRMSLPNAIMTVAGVRPEQRRSEAVLRWMLPRCKLIKMFSKR